MLKIKNEKTVDDIVSKRFSKVFLYKLNANFIYILYIMKLFAESIPKNELLFYLFQVSLSNKLSIS